MPTVATSAPAAALVATPPEAAQPPTPPPQTAAAARDGKLHPPRLLVDRLRTPLYSVTGVNAEHRLIARIVPLENAWAPFAFLTLTFLRNRREHFRRIDFVKLVDQDAIRDRLRQRLEDGGVDGSDDGST